MQNIQGLSLKEATERQSLYGPNALPEPKPPSLWRIFFRQFAHLMVVILIGAALAAALTGDLIDGFAILAIVFLNAILGFIQEFKAENALAALKKLGSPTSKVIREGKMHLINSKEITIGDLIILEAGDLIPADGLITEASRFATNEASLTGESLPVHKKIEELCFMGTTVLHGRAHMVVTSIGIHTELGKIAGLLKEDKEKQTPLQIRLSKLGSRLIFGCLGLIAIILGLSLLKHTPVKESLMTAISLAVAAIPEGLPTVVVLSLAIGVHKMAKRRAIVRSLPSVETLGCTSVICSDKTGTLTQNQMMIQKTWTTQPLADLLEAGVLCTTASLYEGKVIGDPTEGAILLAAEKEGIDKAKLEMLYPLLDEVPFDSETRYMSMTRKKNGKNVTYLKGSPEVICKRLSAPLAAEILEKNQKLAGEALRVLAIATEQDGQITFMGLIAMIDPPRLEVPSAIEGCKTAGIRPIMMTGDHKETAAAIGKKIGLEGLKVVSGEELDAMSEPDLMRSLKEISIYARVTAAHKLRVVRAWQNLGEIVAVTGDGVNDAPAIKEADIGIAMGVMGTEVTKAAADIVITDDNFATIVSAIEEGRGIYDNIVKFVNYLLSSNIAELIAIFACMMIGLKDPAGHPFIVLSAIQILTLNLVTDGLPAIALILDPVEKGAMQRAPRKLTESILPRKNTLKIFLVSTIFATATLVASYLGSLKSIALAQTMAFTTLVTLELIHVQIIRSEYKTPFFSNLWVPLALFSSFGIQLILIYLPIMQEIFETVSLGFENWILVGSICLVTAFFDYLIKKFI